MIHREPSFHRQGDAEVYDKRLDALVDEGVMSYDEAREHLGTPPYTLYELTPLIPTPEHQRTFGGVVLRIYRRNGSGPQFGEEEAVGYPGNVPPYYNRYVPLSNEQYEVNVRGRDMVRQVLADTKIA